MNNSSDLRNWWRTEDWLAVWLGGTIMVIALVAVFATGNQSESSAGLDNGEIVNPLHRLVAKPAKWASNPIEAVFSSGKRNLVPGVLGCYLISLLAFGTGIWLMQGEARGFVAAFSCLFFLAAASLWIAAQQDVKSWNLEYALWALALGLLVSNTVGTPSWMRPGLNTEFYIKTGLVLYGAKVLFGRLMALGPPGLGVAWVVTPIVLITTYWFGQKILKVPSKTLNMVISADMSVCGVSAAIATAAACRAKKEELSLAIGISLSFTVVMMVVMPAVVKSVGMDPIVGGAWIGGTIDSTGAVGAAGEMISEAAGEAAITIKLIQNILIGFTAFGVALYWVQFVDRKESGPRPEWVEIWRRFPKFVIGFLAASFTFSVIQWWWPDGDEIVQSVLNGGPGLKQGTDTLRSWFFALAFVSIGLESDFRSLGKYLRGGKPLILYLCGQSLNLVLTLFMAWLMFTKVFPAG